MSNRGKRLQVETAAPMSMAERVGFEPTVPFGTRALQARALGRTMLPLQGWFQLRISIHAFHASSRKVAVTDLRLHQRQTLRDASGVAISVVCALLHGVVQC